MTRGEDPRSSGSRNLRLPAWVVLAALGVVALAVAAAAVAPRWSSGRTCPAIGYSSLLVVALTGDTAEVAHLQVRDRGRWEPPVPLDEDGTPPAVMSTRDGDTWRFTLVHSPDPVALRVLGDDGEVLARTEVDVAWERVGGSAACGGPMEGHVDWTL